MSYAEFWATLDAVTWPAQRIAPLWSHVSPPADQSSQLVNRTASTTREVRTQYGADTADMDTAKPHAGGSRRLQAAGTPRRCKASFVLPSARVPFRVRSCRSSAQATSPSQRCGTSPALAGRTWCAGGLVALWPLGLGLVRAPVFAPSRCRTSARIRRDADGELRGAPIFGRRPHARVRRAVDKSFDTQLMLNDL